MQRTEAQKMELFGKRLARVKRMCAGESRPSDRRQMRRCCRILMLTHNHLYESRSGIQHGGRIYRRAIDRT